MNTPHSSRLLTTEKNNTQHLHTSLELRPAAAQLRLELGGEWKEIAMKSFGNNKTNKTIMLLMLRMITKKMTKNSVSMQ
jgi:hypothetical protein